MINMELPCVVIIPTHDDKSTDPERKYISIDIVGPLPETKSGNLYIRTIQDNFTKYSTNISS